MSSVELIVPEFVIVFPLSFIDKVPLQVPELLVFPGHAAKELSTDG